MTDHERDEPQLQAGGPELDQQVREHQPPLGSPEQLEADHVADVLKAVEAVLGPAGCSWLVEPNVVLTLAGERGQTESFLTDPTTEGIEALAATSQVLEQFGARLAYDPAELAEPVAVGPSAGHRVLMVNLDVLSGYEFATHATHLPGIEPFDASTGWEGLEQWKGRALSRAEAAQARGEIPPNIELAHLVVGVIKGYPDKAILSLAVSDSPEAYVLSRIPLADMYHGAQPNYEYLKVDEQDPEIIAHQERWAKVLAGYYGSDFYRRLASKPEFQAAREYWEK